MIRAQLPGLVELRICRKAIRVPVRRLAYLVPPRFLVRYVRTRLLPRRRVVRDQPRGLAKLRAERQRLADEIEERRRQL